MPTPLLATAPGHLDHRLPPLIGVAGYGGCGKDALAHELARYGYTTAASTGREVAAAITAFNPIVTVVDGHPWRWAEVQEMYGYDGAKQVDGVLPLLIAVGKAFEHDAPDYWVKRTLARLDLSSRNVVTGARTHHGLNAIRLRGGVLIRLHRPGLLARDALELDLDDYPFDVEIVNDSTQAALAAATVDALLARCDR